MASDLTQIDAARAWRPFEPTADRPWSRRLAAHLYRRAGFGASTAELDEAVKLGPAGAVARLVDPQSSPDFDRTVAMLADRSAATGNPQQVAGWWLYRMLNTPDPLLEKLTLFWHGHFATSAAKVLKARLMLEQNLLLRRHARGKFADLVKGVSRDPAMLLYLDSATNRRIRPNENYARELMELFCLGVGNYTEKDIKEVARAFTGWEVRADRWGFNKSQHDTGTKAFLGQSGNFDGDDAIRIVLEQPAAPQFVARKLIRYFVFDEPAAPDALVEPVAQELRKSDFEIGPAVRMIIGSDLFFSENAVGRKVRSPVELATGLLRALGATTNLLKLFEATGELGQSLLYPPNVKGWDGGRAWINSSTLLGRANMVRRMLTAGETRLDTAGGGSLASLAERAGATSPEQTVDWLLELLVAVAVPADARQALVSLAGEAGDRSGRMIEVVHAISALPEFQLS